MTRKDYVKLAGALAAARAEVDHDDPRPAASEYAIEAVEVRISRILADDNPNFDRVRFHAAAIGQPMPKRDRPQWQKDNEAATRLRQREYLDWAKLGS